MLPWLQFRFLALGKIHGTLPVKCERGHCAVTVTNRVSALNHLRSSGGQKRDSENSVSALALTTVSILHDGAKPEQKYHTRLGTWLQKSLSLLLLQLHLQDIHPQIVRSCKQLHHTNNSCNNFHWAYKLQSNHIGPIIHYNRAVA